MLGRRRAARRGRSAWSRSPSGCCRPRPAPRAGRAGSGCRTALVGLGARGRARRRALAALDDRAASRSRTAASGSRCRTSSARRCRCPTSLDDVEVRGDVTTAQTRRLIESAVDTYDKSKVFYADAAERGRRPRPARARRRATPSSRSCPTGTTTSGWTRSPARSPTPPARPRSTTAATTPRPARAGRRSPSTRCPRRSTASTAGRSPATTTTAPSSHDYLADHGWTMLDGEVVDGPGRHHPARRRRPALQRARHVARRDRAELRRGRAAPGRRRLRQRRAGDHDAGPRRQPRPRGPRPRLRRPGPRRPPARPVRARPASTAPTARPATPTRPGRPAGRRTPSRSAASRAGPPTSAW